ncbi:3-methyl-2-oxobutanoate hydroxymethyltransferase [bacterium]|nr:3-methyl-2-oxobutanoate hydroxymethyltransferase [bacterium]
MTAKGRSTTLDVFPRAKASGRKLAVLTAYDLTSARIAAAGGVDAILVGDSVGMVVLGYETTLPVTMSEMIHHCKAVMRSDPGVPVIADMPYGSFHVSPEETVRQALDVVKQTGVNAVKIEGGRNRTEAISALLAAEIPVMGHLGLTPQSINRFGGYKIQGRGAEAAAQLEDEALHLADLGCFALVLECVPAELARRISARIGIPTIGIGAGAGCDGQVLVFHDLLGLFEGLKPRFVKRYAELGRIAAEAVGRYVEEVRSGEFPGSEHEFGDAREKAPGEEGPASGQVYPGAMDGGGD